MTGEFIGAATKHRLPKSQGRGSIVIPDNVDQHEAAVEVIVAYMRDAERMAEKTATFLKHVGWSLHDDQSRWPPAFLLELAAVLRIHEWEAAGIKHAIDPSLPSFREALANLAHRLRTETDQFIRGEAPLLLRVVNLWWSRCAHPTEQFVNVDVVLPGIDRNELCTRVAQLLWKLRELEMNPSTRSE